jgi:BASS family bile acid:Na+ symporter
MMAGSLFTQLAILGLVLSMLGMGMTLAPADFSRVLRAPWAVAVGLVAQIFGVPLVAVGMALALKLDPLISIALVALAACPGGASSNSLTFLARGDVPLSITLTATNSVLSFVSTPIVIGIGVALFGQGTVEIQLSFADTVRLILLQVVLPVLVGMAMAWRAAKVAAKLAKPLIYVGLFFIVVPTLTLPFRETGLSGAQTTYYVLLCALFNVASVLISLAIASAARLPWHQRRTIMIEGSIQNFGLFIVITSVFFRSEEMMAVGVPYLFWMLISAVAIVAIQRRKEAVARRAAAVDGNSSGRLTADA